MPTVGEELRKITINMYVKDMEWLERRFGQGGVSDAIRGIIRNYVRRVQSQEDDDE